MKTLTSLASRCRFVVLILCLFATGLVAKSIAQSADFHASQLPTTGTVYGVEGGNAPLKVRASETKFNSHAAGNFARSMVYAGPQSSVEIEGATSSTTLTSTTPVLYVRLGGDDPDLIRGRVVLVALAQNKDSRGIALYSANIFGGHRKRSMDEVKIVKTDTDDPQWLKVVPAAPLDPGPYAVVILPKDVLAIPDTAYDFTIPGTPKPKPTQ